VSGAAEPGRLHDYYRVKGQSPTFGSLKTPEDLDRHVAARTRLFLDRLGLPPRLFRDACVLEFGPDTGENALVFARWGATVDLIEPNRQSWPQIESYFRQYGLAGRLGGIDGAALQDFAPQRVYDAVVCEGFIHTIQPPSVWIDILRRAVAPGGFLVLFYYERTALLVDLFHRAVHRSYGRLAGGASVDSARRLFGAKWDAIPHMRRFESWVMDVLDNPYTSTRYTLDAATLVADLAKAGFALHQSWPRYRDELRMAWHKAPETDVVAETGRHLPRLALGHALGKTLFAHGPEAEVEALRGRIDQVLDALEASIETAEAWSGVADGLAAMGRAVGDPGLIFAPDPSVRAAAEEALDALTTLARHLAAGDAEAIAGFAATDPVFRTTWGQPAHYSVFRQTG
jgi:SAM-dependent methyltransferase